MTLPDDIRPQYGRLITAKGLDALAGVNGQDMLGLLHRDHGADAQRVEAARCTMLCKNCGADADTCRTPNRRGT